MMALQGHVDFAVFGDHYDTPDRTAMRDYIHVPDLAAAHVAPLKLLEEGSAGGFNLGTGSGFSVREILTGIQQVPNSVKPRRASRPHLSGRRSLRGRKLLTFLPRHPDFPTVIRTARLGTRRRIRSGGASLLS
ncbi:MULTISPECIES: hypothetical protein [unclassified Bradyrhizobium]|uniref:hypothetical protein n=1 Tax=unclassified Bradyrhizobium TaxID=2631580 RepID=UPI001FF7A7CD|nr:MULTISPECIES: hypothetical protein [unclassified Bradyrhizobium]